MPIDRGIPVGPLPDMVTFTPNGEKLLVANEGTPNFMADEPYDLLTDPPGTVSIIDMRRRRVIATPTLKKARFTGNPRLSAGMNFEPEYISVNPRGTVAYVTLQEANAMAILDLTTNQFTQVIDLGLKDFSLADNGFGGNNFIDPNDEDPKEKPVSILRASAVKGLYQPDALANYQYKGRTYIVMANEGDTREDDGDKVRASKISGSPSDLKRLNVSLPDSPSGDQLVTFGGRSFSIRDDQGRLIYDSGSMLDAEAIARNIYDDKRSDDKGVEPEGVTLLNRWGKVYAFIGLERTKASAVAVFDITNPRAVSFVDMIVTDGDISPEGLVTYAYQGRQYLGISNEVSNTTTVYEITRTRQ
jgi:DNA-binding beta-propeller fold protein YncE